MSNPNSINRFSRPKRRSVHAANGFSLLEILVAMIIIAIGALGIAGLQASALKFSKNSESRALAVQLSNDLLERLRVNDAGLQGGEYASLASMSGATCSTSVTPAVNVGASTDIAFWKNALACSLPEGKGQMQYIPATLPTDPARVEITVQWDESRLKGGSNTQKLLMRTLL